MKHINRIDKTFIKIAKPFIDEGRIHLAPGGKHAMLVRADGHKIPLPSSSSDHRAILNFKTQLNKFVSGKLFGKLYRTSN